MIIDIIIVGILGKTIYNGYKDGIVSTIFYIAGILLGLTIAWYFYDYSQFLLSSYLGLSSPILTRVLAAILPVVLVAYLVWKLGDLVGMLIDLVTLGFADKLFGMIFGMIKGLILIGVIIYLLQKIEVTFDWHITGSSFLYPSIKPLIALIFSALKSIVPIFKSVYDENIIKVAVFLFPFRFFNSKNL